MENYYTDDIYISLLEWLGYSGPKELHKQAFTNLLDRNNIVYKYICYQDPLIEYFPEIQNEVEIKCDLSIDLENVGLLWI